MRIDAVGFVAVVTALVEAIASLWYGYAAAVIAAKLRRLTRVIRTKVDRLVAVVSTLSCLITN